MDVVIIGGVAAGPRAACRLKRLMPDAKITLVNDSELLSYSGCGMPYYVSNDVEDLKALYSTPYGIIRDKAFFENVKGIEVLTPYKAVVINRKEKIVHLKQVESGEPSKIKYDKLVLALGGHPANPRISGSDNELVHTFSKPEDAEIFRKLAEGGRLNSVCIIGAGYIGCEMSEAFAGLWGIETTVIESEPYVLPKVLDEELAALVRAEMEKNGVTVHCGENVENLMEFNRKLKVFYGEQSFEVDRAIIATGLKPNSELADEAGLVIGNTGAILVNKRLETSDKDIYAGGDCIECEHVILDNGVYLPLGSLANRHGRLIANNIAGKTQEFPGVVGTMIVKVFDLNVAVTGITEKVARENDFDVGCVWGSFTDKIDYFPETKNIHLKMVYDKGSKELLGLQAVGHGDVKNCIDLFATLLMRQGELDDLFDIESAYSPPYANALDSLYVLGCIAQNQIDGYPEIVSPDVIFKGGPARGTTIIDIREDDERKNEPVKLNNENIIEVPFTSLREKLPELEFGEESLIVCARGLRGYEAAAIIKESGKGNPKFLGGGWNFCKSVMKE